MSVRIRDPRRTAEIFLNVVGRTADILEVPRVSPPPPGKGWTADELGERTILGVRTCGERFTRTISSELTNGAGPVKVVTEVWFSDTLGLVMEERLEDPRSGTTIKLVTSLEQVEPDAALFGIPQGYAVHSRAEASPK